MQLNIKNIGKITELSIHIDGITVIAGENNSGKSTVSKSLFALFNSLYQSDEKILDAKISNVISTLFHPTSHMMRSSSFFEQLKMLVEQNRFSNDIDVLINDILLLLPDNFQDNDPKQLRISLKESLTISDHDIRNKLINNQFNIEFDGQINHFLTTDEAKIELTIKDKLSSLCFKNNELLSIQSNIHINNQVVYIDDPSILDIQSRFPYMTMRQIQDHQAVLLDLLKNKSRDPLEQIKVDKKLEAIFHKLSSITQGELVKDRFNTLEYKEQADRENIKMRNTSSGLKPFLILKTLLQNGALGQNGILILDEPEIHLHPEWQSVFAEVIVLLQKEFNLHILLTTHSPYFLYAIEVFSAKHEINQHCHYYLSELAFDAVKFTNVSDQIELIYQKLSKAFQKLEDLSNDVES